MLMLVIFSQFFGYRNKAFLENVPIGISGLLDSVAPSLGYMRQKKKNLGTHCCVVLHVLRFLAGLISSFRLSSVGFLAVLSGKNEKCVYFILSHKLTGDF